MNKYSNELSLYHCLIVNVSDDDRGNPAGMGFRF